MAEFLQELIHLRLEIKEDFTVEERNLISVGFKNHIGHFQTAVKIIKAVDKTAKY